MSSVSLSLEKAVGCSLKRSFGMGWVGRVRYDFFPEVLDPSDRCIDRWIKTSDEEAYHMVRTVM